MPPGAANAKNRAARPPAFENVCGDPRGTEHEGARRRGHGCRRRPGCRARPRARTTPRGAGGGGAGQAPGRPRSPTRARRSARRSPRSTLDPGQVARRARGSRRGRARAASSSMTYVELHCHSAYSFLDGASQPEELAARAAELGYEALALTDHDGVCGSLEFAHAAKALGVRADHRRRGHARGRRPRDAARRDARAATRTSAGCSPRRTRGRGRSRPEPLPPALAARARCSSTNDGLVCLSGCARHGLAVRDPNAAARARAGLRARPLLRRAAAPVRARRRAPQRARSRDLAGDARRRDGRDRRRARAPPARAPCSRTRSSRSATAPRSTAASRERRGNRESVLRPPAEMAERFPDDRDAVARTAELAERLEFDLTQELGYRYPDFSDREDPADVQLAPRLRPRVRRALRERRTATSAARASGSTRSSR